MKQVSVVAAVIVQDDKILATQRGYGDFKDGWEFPGGKIEAGERPEDALKREILEELGAEVEVHELIDVVEYNYPSFHLSMMCFRCTLNGRTVQLLEHKAGRWLKWEELEEVEWLPADLILIKKWRDNRSIKEERILKK